MTKEDKKRFPKNFKKHSIASLNRASVDYEISFFLTRDLDGTSNEFNRARFKIVHVGKSCFNENFNQVTKTFFFNFL